MKVGEFEKEIPKLSKTIGSQKIDISTIIIKESIDILADLLCTSINRAI